MIRGVLIMLLLGGSALAEANTGLVWVFYDGADFSRPNGWGTSERIDVDTGTKIQDYSQRWDGYIEAPVEGPVTFVLDMDNDARLSLGKKVVAESRGQENRVEGSFRFESKGQRLPIELLYNQRSGTGYIRLYWQWPGQELALVSAEAFSHDERTVERAKGMAVKESRPSAEDTPLTDTGARRYPGDGTRAQGPTTLKRGPHVLMDGYIFDTCEGVARRVMCPARDPSIPNPVITGEGDGNFQPYMTILRDPEEKDFRVWYSHRREDRNAGRQHIAHMRSQDGIHWKRPPEVLADPMAMQFGISVVDKGPGASRPQERYKFAWWMDGGLKIAVSPDGLTWSPLVPGVVLRHNHDINSIYWDPIRSRYIATASVYREGGPWSGKRRITMQAHSQDLLEWDGLHYVVTPDDAVDDGETQFYAMEGYLPRGDLLIGMIKVLRDDLKVDDPPDPPEAYGMGYTVLSWSRDGETWFRDQNHFFDPSPQKGEWDHAHAWIDEQVLVDDEVFLYYGGYARGHKVGRFEERQIGLVRMPRDRYVGWQAEQGRITTVPLKIEGEEITVNVNARGGQLRAQLLDEGGAPIPGYTLADCSPVGDDGLDVPLTWKKPVAQLKGRPVKLELQIKEATLFALGVR